MSNSLEIRVHQTLNLNLVFVSHLNGLELCLAWGVLLIIVNTALVIISIIIFKLLVRFLIVSIHNVLWVCSRELLAALA